MPTPRSVSSGPATSSGLVVQRGGSAVAGVLVFRLVTYWLPVIPGAAVTFANAP